MYNRFTKCLIIIFLLIAGNRSFAQPNSAPADTSAAPLLLADSLASGSYKDILLSFFQLAANNLTGPNKEFYFTATPFAVMLRNNPGLLQYENYKRTAWARKFNITVNARLDSNYRFDGFATGITYALYNGRDISMQDKKFARLVEQDTNYILGNRTWDFFSLDIYSSPALNAYRDFFKEEAIRVFIAENKDSAFAAGVSTLADRYLAREETLSRLQQQYDSARQRRNTANARHSGNDVSLSSGAAEQAVEMQRIVRRDSILAVIDGELAAMATDVIDVGMVKAFQTTYKGVKDSFCRRLLLQVESTPVKAYNDTMRALIEMLPDEEMRYLRRLIEDEDSLSLVKRVEMLSYDAIAANFQTNGLWTITLSDTSYSDGQLFRNAKLSTAYTKGLSKQLRTFNFEMDAKGYMSLSNDSLLAERNLKRILAGAEAGVNMVIRSRRTRLSYLECKASLSYTNILKGSYVYEQNDKRIFTFNGTIRFRVFNEIWIPIDIKYDPATGNVFGFLNVRTNFKALGNMFQ